MPRNNNSSVDAVTNIMKSMEKYSEKPLLSKLIIILKFNNLRNPNKTRKGINTKLKLINNSIRVSFVGCIPKQVNFLPALRYSIILDMDNGIRMKNIPVVKRNKKSLILRILKKLFNAKT